jgi:hypothetical protein
MTMNAPEMEAVGYLERAAALGHNAARVALGNFHNGRAASVTRLAAAGNKDLLGVQAVPAVGALSPARASARPSSGYSGGSVTPPPSGGAGALGRAGAPRVAGQVSPQPQPNPRGSAVPSSTPSKAWVEVVRYHLKQSSAGVDDLAHGIAPVWDSATHEEEVEDAQRLQKEAEHIRATMRIAQRGLAGAAGGKKNKRGAISPWIQAALEKDSGYALAFRGWRLLIMAAALAALYMAYVVVTAEPSQCPHSAGRYHTPSLSRRNGASSSQRFSKTSDAAATPESQRSASEATEL